MKPESLVRARRLPEKLAVTTADGRILVGEVTYPRGRAHNPITDDEIQRKFTRWTEDVPPRSRRRR